MQSHLYLPNSEQIYRSLMSTEYPSSIRYQDKILSQAGSEVLEYPQLAV